VILPDHNLLNSIEQENLVDNYGDLDQQIQPSSFDIRLGNEFLEYDWDAIDRIDLRDDDPVDDNYIEQYVPDGETYTVEPGGFVLATTKERVEIPPNMAAFVKGRSSIGRLAIEIHSTAGFVDSGYKGEVTLEVENKAQAPIKLPPGIRVGQLVISLQNGSSNEPYGEQSDSKYQDQSGPVPSRIDEDADRPLNQ
jgi:dCTP deaminase